MGRRDYLKHLGFTTAAAIVTANKTKAMSNEPTIEQMNETIALFMGYEKYEDRYGIWFKKEGLIKSLHPKLQSLRYHSSWDQLMPVVKKIYDTLADMLKKRPPHTACQGDLIEIDIHCAIREVDILKAHGYVYQFCLWYKKQKEVNNEKSV